MLASALAGLGFGHAAPAASHSATSVDCAAPSEPWTLGAAAPSVEYPNAAVETIGGLESPAREVLTPQLKGGGSSALSPSAAGAAPTVAAQRSYGSMFLRGWVPLTVAEFGLLTVTAMLPKDWTGWSANFVQDGINHLERAYTNPPVWDTDAWFHNYAGHPYGGAIYYNTVRSQGATPGQSLLFSAVMSTQWEYFFEAFAEQPSIQDLVVTPVAGTILGELSHRLTLKLKKGGTSTGEKIVILLTNPMHAVFAGF